MEHKKYISDIITENEINKWKPGNRILIESQTGSGKSEFVKNNLYEYCKKNNKMILLMSNRNLLKNQNMEDIIGKEKYIKTYNYQQYESRILHGHDIFDLFESYDYIVYDEAHYFFSDSQFNHNTDLLVHQIKETPKDKILILITATPQALIDYQPDYDFKYELPYDYSYIENVYFYNRPKNIIPIIESIISTIPENEKILYFGSSAKDNLRLSESIKNTSFICSSENEFGGKSDINSILSIVKESKFHNRILFSTKMLDNGVNIKDDTLKHIFIDMTDPISFIQCLGRKRILNSNDKIDLYVRNYHSGNIYYISKNFQDKLRCVDKFKKGLMEDFNDLASIQAKTGGIINKYYQINEAKYQHYKTQFKLLNHILIEKSDTKYKKYICDLLNFDIAKTKNANMFYERMSMEDLLEKYEGIKMFGNDIEIFKNLLFNNIFTPKQTDYSARGREAANSIIREDNMDYEIFTRREYGKENRKKYYWIVEKHKKEKE